MELCNIATDEKHFNRTNSDNIHKTKGTEYHPLYTTKTSFARGFALCET